MSTDIFYTHGETMETFYNEISLSYNLPITSVKRLWKGGDILVFDRYSLLQFYVETWPEYSISKLKKIIEKDLKEGQSLKQISNNIFTYIG